MGRFLIALVGSIISIMIVAQLLPPGVAEENLIPIFTLIPAIVIALTIKYFKPLQKSQDQPKQLSPWQAWVSSIEKYTYKLYTEGYGIALDADNHLLHLGSTTSGIFVSRAYPFEDVKEWGYDMPRSGNVFPVGNISASDAAIATLYNRAQKKEDLQNTWFWVKVKDIDNPKWLIKFPHNYTKNNILEKQFDRWMEILSQSINNDVPSSATNPTTNKDKMR